MTTLLKSAFAVTMLMPLPLSAVEPGGQPPGDGETPYIGVYGGGDGARRLKAIEAGVDFFMPSVTWYEPQPWLKGLVEDVRPRGIKVYPSLAMAYDGHGEKQSPFAQAHPEFWEKRRDGRLIDRGEQVSLSWGHPEVRAYKVRTVRALVEATGVDGVLLDYTRYFGNTAGYSDVIVEAFRSAGGKDPLSLPTDDPAWVKFRADYVTAFVADLRAALDDLRPGLKIIACTNPDPRETLRGAMQDWATWVDRGLVDGLVSMIYERDTNNTLRSVMIANAATAGKVWHIPMIAPYGGNLTTPALLKESAGKCLATGAPGVGFYREDSIADHDLWAAIGDIARWKLSEVRKADVNLVLNAAFERELEHWAVGTGEGVRAMEGGAAGGGHCLDLSGPGRRAVRQVIDRGFLPGRKGIRVGMRIDDSAFEGDARIDLEVRRRGGAAEFFRIPVSGPREAWRRIEAHLPLAGEGELDFLAVAIHVDGVSGRVSVDDVGVSLVAEPPKDADAFRVQPAAAPLTAGAAVNVVRGQPVRCSSFWENGFEPARAVDGNLSDDNYGKGSAWHSQRPAIDQWIIIHLPEAYAVNRLRLLNASAQAAYRTRTWHIEASLDNHTYREIARGTLPDDGTTWTELRIPATPARLIRFVGDEGYNLAYAIGLKEIEVYAE